MTNIYEYLRGNPYPGRGILIGRSPDGAKAVIAYFIMGRSENSRNRVFVADGGDLRTKAHDPEKLSDPSLVIYRAVARSGDATIVTNGGHTDTVAEYLDTGRGFEAALRLWDYEPDGPNYTPRISGVVSGDGSYKLSILKCGDGKGGACDRFFFEYDTPRNGVGHVISTYITDGDPLPSFAGEPLEVEIAGSIKVLADGLWAALNAENKVSLFVRYINIASGEYESLIINRHEGK